MSICLMYKRKWNLVSAFFCWLVLLQISRIQSDNECIESVTHNIPICQPGAECTSASFSYTCEWLDSSITRKRSPYMPIALHQPKVPPTWHLPSGIHQPVNECKESEKLNLTLCSLDASCRNVTWGYRCTFHTVRKFDEDPYIPGNCERPDLNWTCPDYDLLRKERLGKMPTEWNDLDYYLNRFIQWAEERESNLTGYSQNTLTEDLRHSLRMFDEVMKLSQNYPGKTVSLFTRLISLVDKSMRNLVGKYQTSRVDFFWRGDISMNLSGFSIAIKTVESDERGKFHEFLDTMEEILVTVDRSINQFNRAFVAFMKLEEKTILFEPLMAIPENYRLVSNIIGANVYKIEAAASFQLRHRNITEEDKPQLRCATWAFNKTTKNYSWSFDGCQVVPSVSSYATNCQCDHVPMSIALLFDTNKPNPAPTNMTAMNIELEEQIERDEQIAEDMSMKTVETLTNRLNDVLRISDTAMKASQNISEKSDVLFINSMILVESSINNLGTKIQMNEESVGNISMKVGRVSVLMTVLEPTTNVKEHVFDDSAEKVTIHVERLENSRQTQGIVVAIKKLEENLSLQQIPTNKRLASNIIGVNIFKEITNATVQIAFAHKSISKMSHDNHDMINDRCGNSFRLYKSSSTDSKDDPQRMSCSAFIVNKKTKTYHWSSDGCQTIHSANGGKIICRCNYVPPSLGLLFDVNNAIESNIHGTILYYLTLLACCICIFSFMVLSVLFNLIQVGRYDFMQLYICVGLFFGNVFFLFGMFVVEKPVVCPVIAIFTEYSFLLAFSWKLIFGCSVMLSLYKGRKRLAKRRYLYLMAFITPAVLVAVSVGADHKSYLQNCDSCWINKESEIALPFFVVIVCAVLVANIVNLFIIRKAFKESKRVRKISLSKERNYGDVLLKISCCMGLPWILGAMINIPIIGIVCAYLFAIANGLQGVVILCHFVFVSKENRKALSEWTSRILRSNTSTSSTLPRRQATSIEKKIISHDKRPNTSSKSVSSTSKNTKIYSETMPFLLSDCLPSSSLIVNFNPKIDTVHLDSNNPYVEEKNPCEEINQSADAVFCNARDENLDIHDEQK